MTLTVASRKIVSTTGNRKVQPSTPEVGTTINRKISTISTMNKAGNAVNRKMFSPSTTAPTVGNSSQTISTIRRTNSKEKALCFSRRKRSTCSDAVRLVSLTADSAATRVIVTRGSASGVTTEATTTTLFVILGGTGVEVSTPVVVAVDFSSSSSNKANRGIEITTKISTVAEASLEIRIGTATTRGNRVISDGEEDLRTFSRNSRSSNSNNRVTSFSSMAQEGTFRTGMTLCSERALCGLEVSLLYLFILTAFMCGLRVPQVLRMAYFDALLSSISFVASHDTLDCISLKNALLHIVFFCFSHGLHRYFSLRNNFPLIFIATQRVGCIFSFLTVIYFAFQILNLFMNN